MRCKVINYAARLLLQFDRLRLINAHFLMHCRENGRSKVTYETIIVRRVWLRCGFLLSTPHRGVSCFGMSYGDAVSNIASNSPKRHRTYWTTKSNLSSMAAVSIDLSITLSCV